MFTATNEIAVSAAFYAAITSGAAVVYDNGAGARGASGGVHGDNVAGLTNGQTYYAVKSVTVNRIKLATSAANAIAGTPVVVSINVASSGTAHDIYRRPVLDSTSGQSPNFTPLWDKDKKMLTLTVSSALSTEKVAVQFQDSQALSFPDTIYDGTKAGITLKVNSTKVPIWVPVPVNVKNGLGFRSASLSYSNPATGEVTAVTFTYKLSGDLLLNEQVNLQLKGFTGWDKTDLDRFIDAGDTSIVIVADNAIMVNAHLYNALTTGDAVTYGIGGGTVINGLADGSIYYVYKFPIANKIGFATSAANAQAATPTLQAIAGVGAGKTHTITMNSYALPTQLTSSTGHNFEADIRSSENITFTCLENSISAGTEVSLTLGTSVGLKIPASGLTSNDPQLNMYTTAASLAMGIFLPQRPTIPVSPAIGTLGTTSKFSYYRHTMDWEFEQQPFAVSDIVKRKSMSGESVGVRVKFTSSSEIKVGEAVFLKLDGFGGDDVEDLGLSAAHDTKKKFEGSWVECTSMMTLVAKQVIPANTAVDIFVNETNGIILPQHGLALNDARMKIRSNATDGPVSEISVTSSEAVGALLTSSVEFDSTLGATSAPYTTVDAPADVILKFSLSGDVVAGETVRFRLKDFSVNVASTDISEVSSGTKRYAAVGYASSAAADAIFTSYKLNHDNNVILSLSGANGGSFVGWWDLVRQEVVLAATEKVYAKHRMTVLIDDKNAMYIPMHGVVENTHTIKFHSNATAAPISENHIEYVQGVGVYDSSLEFSPKVASGPSEITFTLNTTCPLVSGDKILLNLTNFDGPSIGAGRRQSQVTLKGHDGSRRFAPAFTATWHNEFVDDGKFHKDLLLIEATETISETNVASIIISGSNNLTLPDFGIGEFTNITFEVKAACLGNLRQVVANVVPAVGAVSSSSISLGVLKPGAATDINLGFTLMEDMGPGDELIVHLEGFSYGGIGDDDYRSIALAGSDAAEFDALWTNGDYLSLGANLTFPSLNPFVLDNPARDKIMRAADPAPDQEVSYTLPSLTLLGDTSISIDTRSPPTVTNVYTLSGAGPHYFGGLLIFHVEFSDKVNIVVDSTAVTDEWIGVNPYLNILIGGNLRRALYKSGTGTNTLEFAWIIGSGDVDTNVRVAGSHALYSNLCSIWSESYITMANLTIPEPHDYLARLGDNLTPAKLDAQANTFVSVLVSRRTSRWGSIWPGRSSTSM